MVDEQQCTIGSLGSLRLGETGGQLRVDINHEINYYGGREFFLLILEDLTAS